MIDTTNRQRFQVSTDGGAEPYIMVPVAQLDKVRALLEAYQLPYWVDDEAISLGLARVLVGAGVEVLAADRAQPGAVLAADDLGGQRERERVVRPRRHVEVVAVDVRRVELIAVRAGLVDLAGVDDDLGRRAGQAAHARARDVGAEAQPQRPPAVRHPRDVEGQPDALGLDRVALTAEQEAVERDVEREAPALPRGEPQPSEIEGGGHIAAM